MDERNNESIAQMLDTHTPEIQELVQALREVIHRAAPDLSEEIKMGWGNIIYKRTGPVVAISPYSEHVNLNFYKGTSLADPAGVLQGSGREMRHATIRPSEELRDEVLIPMIQQAFYLDS